jgi:hypothetical protein
VTPGRVGAVAVAAVPCAWSVHGVWISLTGGTLAPTAFSTSGGLGDAALWALFAVVPLTVVAALVGWGAASLLTRLTVMLRTVPPGASWERSVVRLALSFSAASLAVSGVLAFG